MTKVASTAAEAVIKGAPTAAEAVAKGASAADEAVPKGVFTADEAMAEGPSTTDEAVANASGETRPWRTGGAPVGGWPTPRSPSECWGCHGMATGQFLLSQYWVLYRHLGRNLAMSNFYKTKDFETPNIGFRCRGYYATLQICWEIIRHNCCHKEVL